MKAADIKRRFTDKFFSERELVVEYDEPDNSAEKEAHAWFNQVQEIIAELPIYHHDNVGQPLEDNQSDVWFFEDIKIPASPLPRHSIDDYLKRAPTISHSRIQTR